MTAKQLRKINRNVTNAYFGFLFTTFFKRPFGYIIALLYIFYLTVIVMIVPSVSHTGPLIIWSSAAFNMQMFNIFFIAAVAAAIAVILFKVGVQDGTELSLSAKPITKRKRVAIKTATYILIMLMINALTIAVLALVKPIFGDYDILWNRTGITNEQYAGLLLSVFMGNVVNMLLFGGIAVFISLVGGQVITMIGSIGIAFILCLLNFIYPLAAGSPKTVLYTTYNTTINSISANTVAQIKGKDSGNGKVKTWAAIQTTTQESGEEINHMDTLEYWTKAEKEAGIKITNYFDWGKQLSLLYSSFGLDDTKKEQVAKGSIGLNNSYKYNIDATTHVTNDDNVATENYPLCIYSIYSKQGVNYPVVRILGGNTGLDIKNWTLLYQATNSSFDSITVLSKDPELILSSPVFRNQVIKSYWTLNDMDYIKEQYSITWDEGFNAANDLFNSYVKAIGSTTLWDKEVYSKKADVATSAIDIISKDKSGVFFSGNWDDLAIPQKSYAISNIVLYWTLIAQQWQMDEIEQWKNKSSTPAIKNDHFPYSSLTVKNWYDDQIFSQEGKVKNIGRYNIQHLIEQIFYSGVYCDTYQLTPIVDPVDVYVNPINSKFEYCETFNNLYQFSVKSFFNTYAIIAVWSSIAIALFAVSIVIYRRTDFK